MKSADLLFLIVSVFFASIESEVNGRNDAEWIDNNLVESIIGTILDEVREIRVAVERLKPCNDGTVEQSQNSNTCSEIGKRAMVQKPPRECTSLPVMQPNSSSMYFFCDTQLNWYMAEKYCKNFGMHLAVVDNEMIFSSFLRQFTDFVKQRGIIGDIGFWIGGTDNGDEGNFYWQSSGQSLRWQKWQDHNPDNYLGNEGCLEITRFSEGKIINGLNLFNPSIPYAFNDANCDFKLRFICEFD